MSANLDIVIQAKNQASAVLKDLNRDLGGLGKGGQQASQQLGTVDKALGSVKTAALGFGAAMATAFVTDKLVSFARSSVTAASDLQESMAKTGEVFKDQTDAVVRWAENSATAFGQSKQDALEAASTFGNLFTAMGLATDASADMSTELVELAADLASFNNIEIAEAITALRAGMVGEVEPMRRLGVQMNAAAVEAKALELGLAGTKNEITEADKVMARYQIVLEQTTTAQGDFARTSEGLANQQRTFHAQWENFQASVGEGLLPIMTALVSVGNEGALPMMTSLGESFSETMAVVTELSGELNNLGLSMGGVQVAGFGLQDALLLNLDLMGKTAGFVGGELSGNLNTLNELLGNNTQEWSDFNTALLGSGLEKAGVDLDRFVQSVMNAAATLGDGSTALERQAEATANARNELIAYNDRIALVRDNQFDWNEHTGESVSVMVELADSMRRATEDGHRHNQMLQDGVGAYDAATVAAGLLMGAQGDLAAVNEIMNQRIADSENAISHWEGRVSDVDTALGYLDEQLAAGNITTDEHRDAVERLTEYQARLAGGIEDDLIPGFIDSQLAAADLQEQMDDLNQAYADGRISEQEYAEAAAGIRDEMEKNQNPIQTLIEKVVTLIEKLIELEDQDPTVEITANTDAILNAIESMRQYAANNPINVPIHGVVAGGNDVPTYVPGGSAGGDDRELQGARSSFFTLGTDAGAVYADGFVTGVAENIGVLMPDMMNDILSGIARDFSGPGIVDIMTGAEAARLQEDAKALEAYMMALVEMGFGPESAAYQEVLADYKELMETIEALTGIAGTEAAQEFWEQWERENAERQYPEQAAREAAENIWRNPAWPESGQFSAAVFWDSFEDVTRRDALDLPKSILFEPDFLDQFADGGATAGEVFAGAFQKSADNMLVESGGTGDGSGPGGSPSSSPGGGGGGGPAATLSDPSMNVFENLAMLASDSYADMVLDLLGLVTPRDKKKGSLGNNADALFIAEFLNRIPFFMGSPSQISEAEFQEWFDYALGNPSAAAKLTAMPFDAFLAELQDGPPIGMATGGYITGEGLAMLHPNEYITPDRSIPQLAQEIVGALRGGMDGMSGNQPINVIVNIDSQTVAGRMMRSTVPGMTLGVDA